MINLVDCWSLSRVIRSWFHAYPLVSESFVFSLILLFLFPFGLSVFQSNGVVDFISKDVFSVITVNLLWVFYILLVNIFFVVNINFCAYASHYIADNRELLYGEVSDVNTCKLVYRHMSGDIFLKRGEYVIGVCFITRYSDSGRFDPSRLLYFLCTVM